MRHLDPAEPICVISPHLDDAVLSCGHFLNAAPGTTVVTVIAGSPEADNDEGNWHHKTTGKIYAPDGVALRRREDLAALGALKARSIHLDFWDAEYVEDRIQDIGAMSEELIGILKKINPGTVLFPVGIHHSDHRAVGEACLSAVADPSWNRGGGANSFAYAEIPYAQAFPDELAERLGYLESRLGTLEECEPVTGTRDDKIAMVRLYASQYEPLRTEEDYSFAFDAAMGAPERYWSVPNQVGP